MSSPAAQARRATMAAPGAAYGVAMTQDDMMASDTCVVVDESDAVVGSGSKRACHVFDPASPTPTGILHRAFSVFLFNGRGELLLQQRALSKVTFPGVWTNTCCSHPLHGYTPTEVDGPEEVAAGTAPGIRRAAVRKLTHELGMDPAEAGALTFRFVTRLHYCAADAGTAWGEHEIDYILLCRADVAALDPNLDEVEGVRYVSRAELAAMMDRGSGHAWSPWFRIIAREFLPTWWDDLDGALAGRMDDLGRIHRLAAPP